MRARHTLAHSVAQISGKGWLLLLVSLCACVLWPMSAASAERISVRTGEHPGFSRLVFDWPTKVDYSVVTEGSTVRVGFSEQATINLTAVREAGLKGLRGLDRAGDGSKVGAGLSLRLEVAPGAAVSHFRDGTKVVIDVALPVDSSAEAQADFDTVADDAPKSPTKKPVTAAPEVKAKPAPEVDAASEPVSAPDAEKDTRDKAGQFSELARTDKVKLEYSGAPVAVRSEPVFNGVRLTYPLAEPLPAAVFQRGGYLWVIFERYRPVDHAGLGAVAGKRILKIEQIAHPHATILRYRIAGGQHVVAHRREAAWIVELKENRTTPRIPLEVSQHRYNGGPAVFLPVSDVGSRVDITDPEVGDEVTVVPVLPAGRGVAEDRRFAQFRVVRSAQGVAVEVKADGVLVERFRNGVAISAPGGLALSKDRYAPRYAGVGEDQQSAADKPRRLIDFESWRRGTAEDYHDNRHELLHRLSMAPEVERNGVRWDLARFYLAHGFAAQALGVLELMVADDPDLLDNPEFRATRGVALIELRRFTGARNDLAHTGLDAESDAYLWRALAAAGLGRWQAALTHFERGADVLSSYGEADRIRFELAALKAADQLDKTDLMEEQIRLLTGFLLPPDVGAEVEYLQARLHLKQDNDEEALESLKKVEAANERPSSAKATLARVDMALKADEIAAEDAIDELERLRFAWRGDRFELDLLDRLGRLYIEEGDYRTGFNILRQAVTYFPESPRTRDITAAMSGAFRDLFLGGEAEAMPPIEALALYYDFRELTPLGAEGDKMIRRLADRLVAVDLLGRAADLLEHQVRYRLEGVAQGQVAGRLAMIYLLDLKPEKALAVLRATRQTIIPDDIERARRHLEARALIDLKRYEEAEVLLEGDRDDKAELLRADLYWNAGEWQRVVANGERLLGERWKSDAPLSNDERRQILRMAVALSLDDNAQGLQSIRERYGTLMADGAYASAFDVITAKQDPSEREIKELTESIASVNRLEGFMSSYREEFSGT